MGDESFEQFVAARGSALLRTATLLSGGNRAAGEDLLQGALERTLRKWRTVAPDQPEAYVRRAMVNATVSRRGRRFVEVATEAVPDRPVLGDATRLPDRDQLRTALARLPARQRAVLILRFYDDCSEAETARLLGCPVGTVKSLVSRGLTRLRNLPELDREETAWTS